MKKKPQLAPDFIQIPYQLIGDKKLAPIDRLVYGAIYFYSKMRGERCYATNMAIAKLLMTTSKTVSRSLQKLEDNRYIIRGFADPETKVNRVEIIPLVAMGRLKTRSTTTPNGGVIGQVDTTPNGVPTTPNGVPKYPISGTHKSNGILDTFDDNMALDKDKDDPSTPFRGTPNGISNRDSIENNKKNKDKEYQCAPSGTPWEPINSPGHFTKLVKEKLRYEKLEDVSEIEISECIGLFLSVFPSQFVSTSPFATPANRTAVRKILMTVTVAEFKEVIDKYVSLATDKYRPEVPTIATFCNRFDQIKGFVKKSAGGLWAHRSISSPEQSKIRDEQYQKVIDASHEKTQKAKEAWLESHPEEKL